MALRLGFHRATPTVVPGSCSCKSAVGSRFYKGTIGSPFCKCVVISTPPAFRSNNKSYEIEVPEKGTPASSHASTPAPNHINTLTSSYAGAFTPVESTLALKYSKMDLMRILKIFSKIKSQKLKVEVLCKQSLKAKALDLYFEKLHIDCYHFCQKCEDYFKTIGTIRSNCILFATLFLRGKINFWWHQYWKQLGGVFIPWEEFKTFLRKILETLGFS